MEDIVKSPDLILDQFNKPKIIGIAGERNGGKSNILYFLIKSLKENHWNKNKDFSLYTYGLRRDLSSYGERKISSTEEMEKIHDAILFVDEFPRLLDIENRKQKTDIENTLRLINHNNVILVLSATPHNYNKFLSGLLDCMIFTHSTIKDFINGSPMKNVAIEYQGQWRGSRVLSIKRGYALLWDGNHYDEVTIPYLSEFDTKAANQPIFYDLPETVQEIVPEIVPEKPEEFVQI